MFPVVAQFGGRVWDARRSTHMFRTGCVFSGQSNFTCILMRLCTPKRVPFHRFFLDFFQAVGTHRVGCQILAWHARLEKVNLQGKLKLMRFKQMCDFSGTPFQLFVALCVGGFKQTNVYDRSMPTTDKPYLPGRTGTQTSDLPLGSCPLS